MLQFPRNFLLYAATALLAGIAPASAQDHDQAFFERIEGRWSGAGEIVAGKYKGTKFVCDFSGSAQGEKIGMGLSGGCRVGVFRQEMSATIRRASSGFEGTFLDGAEGKGLDVVGGIIKDDHAVFAIHRKQLSGAMRAQLSAPDTMAVTVSVHVEDELVPVIGVTLRRMDRAVTTVEAN